MKWEVYSRVSIPRFSPRISVQARAGQSSTSLPSAGVPQIWLEESNGWRIIYRILDLDSVSVPDYLPVTRRPSMSRGPRPDKQVLGQLYGAALQIIL